MKKQLFIGSAVAIVTPFTEDGVDYQTLEKLIEFQIEGGSDGIVICGTTGEASTMPDDEHIAVIKFAVEKVNKRVRLLLVRAVMIPGMPLNYRKLQKR